MAQYHNFIGIDIGKFNFVVSVHGHNDTKEYENSSSGIGEFFSDYAGVLDNSLCILETTGGYEIAVLYSLCSHKCAVHRADTRKVKNFIRSFGNAAKSDQLDAKALAKYGFERQGSLEPFQPPSAKALELFQLIQRRCDLKQMLVAEKNRVQAAATPQMIKDMCNKIIKVLSEQIEAITSHIKEVISSDPVMKEKYETLKTIPGVGEVTAFSLIILLPELGQLTRRQIASLAGLAPMANDSGRFRGYRKTGHGRSGVKPALFMAAMAARNSNSQLKEFYEKLIARGKKKMVALTALMRKIIVIANARVRDCCIIGIQAQAPTKKGSTRILSGAAPH